MTSSLSANSCGSSCQARTTSGPEPTFAETEVSGRRSSQLWLSTVTSTPVLLGEFLGIGIEQILIALDELRGPEHAQLRALLDRVVGRRRIGDGELGLCRPPAAEHGRTGQGCSEALQRASTVQPKHRAFSLIAIIRAWYRNPRVVQATGSDLLAGLDLGLVERRAQPRELRQVDHAALRLDRVLEPELMHRVPLDQDTPGTGCGSATGAPRRWR